MMLESRRVEPLYLLQHIWHFETEELIANLIHMLADRYKNFFCLTIFIG